jgi:hypothetical protein
MSDEKMTAEGYTKLKSLSDNEIAGILQKTGMIQQVSQLTSTDFFLIRQGKYTKTMLDLKASDFSKDLPEYLDINKGKIKVNYSQTRDFFNAKFRFKHKSLEIPVEHAKHKFSESQRNELESKGYLKDSIQLTDYLGNKYDAFVSVDKELNLVTSMPISRLSIPKNALGQKNPLTDDQVESLRKGYPVTYFGYIDSKGEKSTKAVGIDRINGIVKVSKPKSGLDAVKKAEVVQSAVQEHEIAENPQKKSSKSKSV